MITITKEALSDRLIRALTPLIGRNWEETGGFADLDLDIDWGTYKAMDDVGVLYPFVAFDTAESQIAGLLMYIVAPCHPHDRKLRYAVQDTIYVEPDYRGGNVSARLINHAEEYLALEGVGVVTQAAKPGSRFNDLLVLKGYEHSENMYIKRI